MILVVAIVLYVIAVTTFGVFFGRDCYKVGDDKGRHIGNARIAAAWGVFGAVFAPIVLGGAVVALIGQAIGKWFNAGDRNEA